MERDVLLSLVVVVGDRLRCGAERQGRRFVPLEVITVRRSVNEDCPAVVAGQVLDAFVRGALGSTKIVPRPTGSSITTFWVPFACASMIGLSQWMPSRDVNTASRLPSHAVIHSDQTGVVLPDDEVTVDAVEYRSANRGGLT